MFFMIRISHSVFATPSSQVPPTAPTAVAHRAVAVATAAVWAH